MGNGHRCANCDVVNRTQYGARILDKAASDVEAGRETIETNTSPVKISALASNPARGPWICICALYGHASFTASSTSIHIHRACTTVSTEQTAPLPIEVRI